MAYEEAERLFRPALEELRLEILRLATRAEVLAEQAREFARRHAREAPIGMLAPGEWYWRAFEAIARRLRELAEDIERGELW